MLTQQDLVHICLSFPATSADHPYGPEVLVARVVGKSFAIISEVADPPHVSLKCHPGRAIALREQYAAVTPGYHLNKQHWNTILVDGSIPDAEIREFIEHSYDLVVASLTRTARAQIPS